MNQENVEKSVMDIVNIKFNWEDRGFTKPNDLTMNNSIEFVRDFFTHIDFDKYSFIDPLVYSNEDGEVTLGFHHYTRALRFYIKDNYINYRKFWKMKDEFGTEDGEFSSTDYVELWEWLTK